MSLYYCGQKRHPSKTWQQRGPFTANSRTSLRVNVGEQRPTLSKMGSTPGATLGQGAPGTREEKVGDVKDSTSCLKDYLYEIIGIGAG